MEATKETEARERRKRLSWKCGGGDERERGEKARDEGGFEEAALRPRRDQRERKKKGNTHTHTHTQKGRRRKKWRGVRETGETSRANFNANELLHWQIIRGSHPAILFRVEQRGEEILESSSKFTRVIGFEIYGASRYSADLSSSTTKGWDRIGRDERHSNDVLDVPADS